MRFSGRALEKLAEFLQQQRWFGGKARVIGSIEVIGAVPFIMPPVVAHFLLIEVRYREGPCETYSIPLIEARDQGEIPSHAGGKPVPYIEIVDGEGGALFLYDAAFNQPFQGALLTAIRENRRFSSDNGELQLGNTPALGELTSPSTSAAGLLPTLMRAEQSNTSIIYGDRLVLKLFRRIEAGINPDVEIGRFLTERSSYANVPLMAGSLEYVLNDGTRMSMGLLQTFVSNRGDGWQFTLRELEQYLKTVRSSSLIHPSSLPTRSLLELKDEALPNQTEQLIGSYLSSARLLGRRTGELHLALAESIGDPAFDPEPYSASDQNALVEKATNLLHRNFGLLRQQASSLPPGLHASAAQLLDHTRELERRFRSFGNRPLTSLRTRIHGDYHLGQVLVTDHDFVIIDFEGEPARPLSERRKKQSPLQDIAGMLRSFHYAAYAPLIGAASTGGFGALEFLEPWARSWQMWVSAAFLRSYFDTVRPAPFLSRESEEVATILELHLLEKSIYELGYELNNRPKWVGIPLGGIVQLIAEYRRAA